MFLWLVLYLVAVYGLPLLVPLAILCLCWWGYYSNNRPHLPPEHEDDFHKWESE